MLGIALIILSILTSCNDTGSNIQEEGDTLGIIYDSEYASNISSGDNKQNKAHDQTLSTSEIVDVPIPDEPVIDKTAYIFITNANQSIEPVKLREGDEFLGLTLREIASVMTFYDDDGTFLRHSSVVARFTGEMTLGGSVVIFDNIASWRTEGVFRIGDDYLHLFPQLVYNEDNISFEIINFEKLVELLGMDSEEIFGREWGSLGPTNYIDEVFTNLTITVDNFTLVYYPASIISFANIIHLCTLDSYAAAADACSSCEPLAGNRKYEANELPVWQIAYRDLLINYIEMAIDKSSDGSNGRFILYDIDRDGVPELLIFASHGIFNQLVSAYTFLDDLPKLLESQPIWLTSFSTPYDGRAGMIANSSESWFFSHDLFILEDGKIFSYVFFLQDLLSFQQGYDDGEIYIIGHFEVSKEEFFELFNTIVGENENRLFPIEMTHENISSLAVLSP